MKCKPYRRKRLLKAASIMEAARAPPGRPSATDHSIFLLALNYGLIKHSYTLLRRCLAPLRRFRSACVWALIPYNFHLFYCETTLYTRLIQFWNALVKLKIKYERTYWHLYVDARTPYRVAVRKLLLSFTSAELQVAFRFCITHCSSFFLLVVALTPFVLKGRVGGQYFFLLKKIVLVPAGHWPKIISHVKKMVAVLLTIML